MSQLIVSFLPPSSFASAGSFLVPAYIDPTGGLPPSVWTAILTIIAGGLTALAALLRLFGRRVAQTLWRWRWLAGIVLILTGVGIWQLQRPATPPEATPADTARRVVVLAFDGLDPRLLQQYMDAGILPAFSQLAREGVWHELVTTDPPQSPVAWCTFITGSSPHDHGVFDFIRRDPSNYRLDLALADRRQLKLPWRGTPIWERPGIAAAGFVGQRLPMVFPPPKRMNGRLLAGMGVWDVRGTEGTYFFYSHPPLDNPQARGMFLPLRAEGDVLWGELPGPYRVGEADEIRVPFELRPARAGEFAMTLQGTSWRLPASRWSDWIEVEFRMGPLGLDRIRAVTRVLFERTGERVSLYVSPLHFDPRQPAYPISTPRRYSTDLAGSIGLYASRGMPFDTQALSDGVLSDDGFLEQVEQITGESEAMLKLELSRFSSGVLFAYFEASDVVQHMFWRTIDERHSLYGDPDSERHRHVIPDMYRRCDAILRSTRDALGDQGEVVVMSDHGFAAFRRAVHLNSVLRELGYLKLQAGDEESGDGESGELFARVDWSETRAYAVGFNSVYLNTAGREAQGIVSVAERAALLEQLAVDLKAWRDPVTNDRPMKRLLTVPSVRDGPDLLVGYRRGYRASWQTALGAVPVACVEENVSKWSGDHCIDSTEVPGIFLSSHPQLDARSLGAMSAMLESWF